MKSKCNGCTDESPSCLTTKVPIKLSLDDIINRNLGSKTLEIFTCPCDAIDFVGGKVTLDSKCIGCNICKYLCNKKFNWEFSTSVSDSSKIINSLKHLQLFLELNSENKLFFSEVSATGYSRNKRIDIVSIENKNITLIKASYNLSKINFYLRSYFDIIEEYSRRYPDFTFSVEVISNNIDKCCSFLQEFNNVPINLLKKYMR